MNIWENPSKIKCHACESKNIEFFQAAGTGACGLSSPKGEPKVALGGEPKVAEGKKKYYEAWCTDCEVMHVCCGNCTKGKIPDEYITGKGISILKEPEITIIPDRVVLCRFLGWEGQTNIGTIVNVAGVECEDEDVIFGMSEECLERYNEDKKYFNQAVFQSDLKFYVGNLNKYFIKTYASTFKEEYSTDDIKRVVRDPSIMEFYEAYTCYTGPSGGLWYTWICDECKAIVRDTDK